MAQSIGQVIFISGNVKAVDSSGNERELDINSMVFLGETIVTEGSDSRVMLKMDNNQSITMGRNDKLTLDGDIYDPENMPIEESIVSVEDIQEALLNDPNFDPSELEAAAAGDNNQPIADDSSTAPTVISHIAQDVEFQFLDTDNPDRDVSPADDVSQDLPQLESTELTAQNDDPVAVNDSRSVSEDASATVIDVLANDTDLDGDSLSVSGVTQ
ncbi:MAG: hypothetical protein GY694_20420, partial [Gammaproteobacteria bacterium]|nr:hypothetical protein [Gammaproteobacteria bacterium]